jgi:hypothetical protein
VAVVLVTAMQHGLSPPREFQIRQAIGVSRQTLERWRKWWTEAFGHGGFFKGLRGLFRKSVDRVTLPLSLMGAFDDQNIARVMEMVLRLLLPISSQTATLSQKL